MCVTVFSSLPASVSFHNLCIQFGPRSGPTKHRASSGTKLFDTDDNHERMSSNKGMFKNNEAFHFMASYAHVCLDFKDHT